VDGSIQIIYFNNKYSQYDLEYKSPSELNEINWAQNNHEIRFSEVLLIASELNIGIDQTKADLYLNCVRSRAGMPIRVVSIDIIRYERKVNPGGEGVRYFDLL